MLTPKQLSVRINVPIETLQYWRTRRNSGEDIGPKFIKLAEGTVRYLLAHVEEWERRLAENAA
jgi:hypothetical protein